MMNGNGINTPTPEELRTLADQLSRTLGKHPLFVESASVVALCAAADAVGRLNQQIVDMDTRQPWMSMSNELAGQWLREHDIELNEAKDSELDRLRTVIENAPHDDDCWLRKEANEGVLPEHRKCTCWKAGAQ